MRVLEVALSVALAAVPVTTAAQTTGAPTTTGASTPFVPQPILQGGEVFALFPPGSPFLKADRVAEPEQNTMSRTVPGRVSSIVNIHNPTIELHRVEAGINTGAAVILIAGGGHNTLERGDGGSRLRSVLLQLRGDHDHPAQPTAQGRLQRSNGCCLRCAAGGQDGAVPCPGVGHRSAQDRAAWLFGGSRARRAGGPGVRGVRQGKCRCGRPTRECEFASGLRRPRLPRPDAVRARPCHAGACAPHRPRSSRARDPATPSTRSGRISIWGRC